MLAMSGSSWQADLAEVAARRNRREINGTQEQLSR